jgi:hypothetical protein
VDQVIVEDRREIFFDLEIDVREVAGNAFEESPSVGGRLGIGA